MRRTTGLPLLVLLGVAMAIGGCTARSSLASPSPESPSIAGTYNCSIEGQPTREVWELEDDGTLVVTPEGLEPEEGTWTMQDDQVIINFSGADNDPFNVEGDRLVFAGPAGPEGTWTCTKAN